METISALPEALANKLRRINDLTQKLLHVKWSQEFLVLLLRATREASDLARSQPNQQRITVLTERLEHYISTALEKGILPRGTDRERLTAVLETLGRLTSSPGKKEPWTHRFLEISPLLADSTTTPTDLVPTVVLTPSNTPTIWLVVDEGQEESQDLARKLEQRGTLRTQLCPHLANARHLLEAGEPPPAALIVDLDTATNLSEIFQEVVALKQSTPNLMTFFLSERGDITARIEAAKAGGSGYFTKPVNFPIFLETLYAQILKLLSQRVLIVDDQVASAREVARCLDRRGMVTQTLTHPIHILPVLYSFQPDLLILNLDIAEPDGVYLALAIQQHEAFRELPFILLSAQTDIGQRLVGSTLSSETLLNRPPNPEILLAAVARRLREDRGIYQKFSQLSHRDTVSGLYNRPYFLTYLEHALIATAASAQSIAVILITLDNLRTLESQDVTAVDEIIEQVAQRLQAALGPETVAARFSDVIFTAVFRFTGQETLPAMARAVQTALESPPYPTGQGDFQLRTSIGVSIAGSALREAALLIQQADLACGMARQSKEQRIHIHYAQEADSDLRNPQQRRLLEEIREAIQQQRMNLLFQPIVSLHGDTTERYEVLLRMRNREGWELLPETVFSLAKRHRIGMVLDRWVIAHSIRVLRERQLRGQSAILFINISPTILQDEGLLEWLAGGLQKTGVPAECLVFEMAESTANLHQAALLPILGRLKSLGCGFSLDRFSGHERSQVLAEALGADYAKLDNRFALDLINDKARQQELTCLAQKLGRLGMTTVVTGVENAMTLPVLWSCGINYVQGFFLQRPHTEMSYDFGQTPV